MFTGQGLFLTLIYMGCSLEYKTNNYFSAFAAVGFACRPDEMVRGCRIHEGHCICGLGCSSDFKYPTREDCRQALKGKWIRYDLYTIVSFYTYSLRNIY